MPSPRHYQIKQTKVKSPPLAARIIHYKHLGLSVCLGMSSIILFKLLFSITLSKSISSIKPYNNKQFVMSFQGQIEQAQLSLNEENVIFSGKPSSEKFYQIYSQSLTENTIKKMPQRLTTQDKHFWLVNRANNSNKIAYITETDTECNIYTASVINQSTLHNQQKLKSCEQYYIRDITWSHDNHFLYFLAKDKTDEKRLLPSQEQKYQIYQLELTSLSIKRFAQDDNNTLSLSASPDGQWISTIEMKDKINWQINLYNIATKNKKTLLKTSLHINDISWESHGRNIILATSEGPKKLSLTGEVDHLLSQNTTMHARTAHLSKNNQLLISHKSWSTSFLEYKNPLHSNTNNNKFNTAKTILPKINYLDKYFPTFANSSRQLAFVSYRNNSTEIMLYDPQNGEKQLTNKTPYDFSLTQLHWSPNDKNIMFTANNAIYLLAIDSGIITRVGDSNFLTANPSWSANGQHIYFSSNKSGEWQVWRINLAGEELTQITYQGGFGAKESNDGKILYFHKHQQTGLWRKILNSDHTTLAQNDETLMINDFSPYAYISWQVFNQGIYYHSFNNNKSSINFWDINTKNQQLVMEKYNDEINCSQFSISYDQQLLTVLHGQSETELLLLTQ